MAELTADHSNDDLFEKQGEHKVTQWNDEISTWHKP